MPSTALIMSFAATIAGPITAASDALFELCNQLAGRSWLFDNVMALAVNNSLFKAALIGGCFFAVWHGNQRAEVVRRNRRTLLVTLLASAVVIATTQTLSKSVLSPRPYVQSVAGYQLRGAQLVETPRLSYRVPMDNESQARYRALTNGDVVDNDLVSFPSDHAGFYVTLAVGILLASRRLGWLAVAWTALVVLGSRVITGQHSPLDIVAGALIGLVILGLMQYLCSRSLRPLVDAVVRWTFRYQALSTALVFLLVFEAANALQDLRPLMELGAGIAARPFF